MKKKHHVKFKPLQELYDHGVTLLKPKAVDLSKVSLKESTIDRASDIDPSRDRKVKTHQKLPSSEASNLLSMSCQSSYSEDFQSLDSLKAPDSSKVPVLQHVTTSQATVEHKGQDSLDCLGDDNSCISKDDAAGMISSGHIGVADNKIATSSAASVNSSGPEILEKSLNGPSIGNGSPVASAQDPRIHNQNIIPEDGSDELIDVRVCDICGDAGRDGSLVLCSKCNDGAEHIYCMSPKMDKVPEGDWFCEECLLMQDPKRQKQVLVEKSDSVLKPSCSKELYQGSPTITSAIHPDAQMNTNEISKTSCLSNKKLEPAVDVRSETKKKIIDKSVQTQKISGLRESQLTQVSSLKSMNEKDAVNEKDAALQVSSFVDLPDKKMVKQACSSPKPEQKSCGGSLNNKKIADSSDSNVGVRRPRKDIHRRRRSAKDNADCELKNDQPDKKVFKPLSLMGASSIPQDISNIRSRNSTKKLYSVKNKTNQVGSPSAGFIPKRVSSSRTKVVPKIVKVAHSPRKKVEDKTGIQLNGNMNAKALDSLVHEGKKCMNTSVAGSAEEKKSPSHSSYGINSQAKKVNAPDLGVSLSTQKAVLDEIARGDNDQSDAYKALSFDFQHEKIVPTLDSVVIDHMVTNVTPAFPEFRSIWKGTFKLEKGGKLPSDCYGVQAQAHLSTHASSKVAESALKFSDVLLLKEVPRLRTWPLQFQKNYPTEQDIALYFFAQDLSSYGRSYKMLLEGMINNDLALETNFGGIQLLVFPSSLLPWMSQCWNSLPFLWGVLRARKIDGFHVPDLNAAAMNQDLYSPGTCEAESNSAAAPVSGIAFASCTTHMHGLESANPVVLQSLALTKSGDQSVEHEVPSPKKHIGTSDTVPFVHDCRKEDFGRGQHGNDSKKENSFSDNNMKSPRKIDVIQHGLSTEDLITSIGLLPDESYMAPASTQVYESASEFWQRQEMQAETSEYPRNYNAPNLNICLGNRVNLDLALGFPSKGEEKPKNFLKDETNYQDENVSLVLSLGMPCLSI